MRNIPALQTAENLRAGLPPAEARRQAVLKFGAVEAIKEDYRAERGMLFIENLLQDSRYALRMLRKSPGFTLIAIVTLALGIGANAVVFSLLNGLVLRPINVPGGKDIYQIEQGKEPSQSYPNYLDIRDRNRAFDGVAAYEIERAGLDTNGTPDPIWIYETSGNYFDMLRVQPFLGRFFHLSDEHGFNSSPYLVLSYGYWQSHFQGDRGVIGRVVRLNRHVYSIAGVAPPGFRGTEIFYSPDVFAPIVDQEQIEGLNSLTDRGNNTTWLVGRLKSGVTVSQAKADLDSIAAVLIKAYPKNDEGLHFALGRPGLVGDTLGGPVRAIVAGLDAACGSDSAGRVRQPGQPLLRASRGPMARGCVTPCSRFEPGKDSAPIAHRGRTGLAGRRGAGHCRLHRSAASAERMAAYPRQSHQRAR